MSSLGAPDPYDVATSGKFCKPAGDRGENDTTGAASAGTCRAKRQRKSRS
jgi:hypothetical protein